jgi:hypothetical protein
MPFTTVVAGTVITASWGNMVRDQLVTPFADAAARAAQVLVPVAGMVSWLSDVKRLEAYDSASWVPASPYRLGGITPRTSDVTMTTTETLADSFTVTCVAGRRYRLMWSGSYYSTQPADSVDIRLRYAAGAAVANTDALIKGCAYAEPAANHNLNGTFIAEVTGIAAGQTTFGVFGVRTGGSGTVHLFGSAVSQVFFFIEDIGV